ncbi:MAG TPA: SAM-dependent DNA methyltransferase [Actinomycetota bacterium]
MRTATVLDSENARLLAQADIDGAKTQSERNRLGQFATPPELAEEVLRSAVALMSKSEAIDFLDPGIGTGSFFSALLRVAADRVRTAQGFEIDPAYGERAQAIWRDTELRLELNDFTRAIADDHGLSNLVVCNPPYVRHHHLASDEKVRLQRLASQRTGIMPGGLSGLYCYFLLLADTWMRDDGIAAWLIPSEFMDVNYGQALKEYLLDRVTLIRVHRFDPADVQFGDALVSSAVLLFRKASPRAGHLAEFSFGRSLLSPKTTSRFSLEELRTTRKWTRLPLNGRARSKQPQWVLGDLFTVKRGVATGSNEFFVLPESRAAELRLPRSLLKPILPSPRYLATDEVRSDAHGVPRVDRRLFLLSCRLPEQHVRHEYRNLWDYLQSGIAMGIDQRYLCRARSPWYSQEHREPAPIVCTYMGREGTNGRPFRFILNDSKATAANVYLMMYPRPILAEILSKEPSALERIWRMLQDLTPDQLMSEGRVYGGGLYKLEPRELLNVSADAIVSTLGDLLLAKPGDRTLFL